MFFRSSKLSAHKQEKLCDDSSLLFKDSSPKMEDKLKARRKSKRSSKKANAENTSIPNAAETQPVMPSFDSEKGIFQHGVPHDTCDVSDMVLVKSHLPLNVLENTRSRDTNLETPVKLMDDSDNPRRLLVIPCSVTGRCTEGQVKADFVKEQERPDVNERVGIISKATYDHVPGSISEDEHLGVLREEICENSDADNIVTHACDLGNTESSDIVLTQADTQPVTTTNEFLSEDKPKSPGNATNSALMTSKESKSATPSASVVPGVSKAKDPIAKTGTPSDCSLDLISVDDGDWDSIYDDSGDCLISHSASSSPRESRTQVSFLYILILPLVRCFK